MCGEWGRTPVRLPDNTSRNDDGHHAPGRRRIAFLLTQDSGGPVDVAVALVRALEGQTGYDVRLFGPAPRRGHDLVAHLHEPAAVDGKAAVRSMLTTRRQILAWRPDVVHAQDRRAGLVCAGLGRAGLTGLPGLRGRKPLRPTVVHTYHGVPDDVSQEWIADRRAPAPSRYTRAVLAADAAVARSVQRTIVVAPTLRDFLVNRLRVPAARVVHIDNGLVLPPAAPPTGPVRSLLFVGLLVERKGVAILLDAMARAIQLGLPPDVTLTVVGDGPQRSELERTAQALGLAAGSAARVSFLGFRADVPALMAGADAFVLPSLLEQQPLVLIEAMAAGLPVLATDVGGVRDMLAGLGRVVPAGDVNSLARGLLALAADDGAATGAGLARRARERFDVALCLRRHLELYAELRRWRSTSTDGYRHNDDLDHSASSGPPSPNGR
jgi:glycosyltransferase involved in cell wall biosynthesis